MKNHPLLVIPGCNNTEIGTSYVAPLLLQTRSGHHNTVYRHVRRIWTASLSCIYAELKYTADSPLPKGVSPT